MALLPPGHGVEEPQEQPEHLCLVAREEEVVAPLQLVEHSASDVPGEIAGMADLGDVVAAQRRPPTVAQVSEIARACSSISSAVGPSP